MHSQRLDELLTQFPRHRIAVLGDFFLDKYLEVSPELAEPSLETGRVAHQVLAIRRSPGAAGTVVNNLAALGATQLHAIGAVGDDGEAFDLCKGLNQIGCSTDGLLRCPELMTPTYLKPHDQNVAGLEGEHSRYDTKNRVPTPQAIVDRIAAELERVLPQVDALLIMDQVEIADCGVVTTRLRDRVAELARRFSNVIFWADSRRFIRSFRNTMIKANQFEAVHRLNPAVGEEVSAEELRRLVPQLRTENQATVFVTYGERGIWVSDPEVTLVPGVKVRGPIDPTGAGDSASAGAVMSLCSGATAAEAALVANLVASITVQQLGTTGTASPDQVRAALQEWHSQQGQS
ncbi:MULTISPECIES: bifunctional heptose 7-phosphate kinase/heptose 1-phosphate adenyltransferase [unclassified Schlesneria]|uniref:bifunctional heptose 7-phosphate kinase/heptose 1-phosphate adenyltransferase n=1 Tax=unclassified Schlesneria TaxID=2762017 RepID=UPI002F09BA4A